MLLKSLNCNFVSEADILRLNFANVQTIDQIITHSDLNSLSQLTKIPSKNLQLLRKFIIGQYAPFPKPANTLLTRSFPLIETGCRQIDELLSNGVCFNEITEITGLASSGKTQFCLNLAASLVTSPSASKKVLYIDSNKGFCPIRVAQLIRTKLQIPDSGSERIKSYSSLISVVECSNPFQLLDILFDLRKSKSEKPSTDLAVPNLLIIDTLNNLFSVLFKPGYSLDASFYLASISDQLKFLAVSFNMAVVVVTNSCEGRINNLFTLPSWVRRILKIARFLINNCLSKIVNGAQSSRLFKSRERRRPNQEDIRINQNKSTTFKPAEF